MKRKIITLQESCSGCPYFSVKTLGSHMTWHCDMINLNTKSYSPYDTTEELYKTMDYWFNELCPLEKEE